MRLIKTALNKGGVPAVFLDVDDLTDVYDAEGYLERSRTVLVFCTKFYCDSQNTMRELVSAVGKQKPVIALVNLDESSGGLSLDAFKKQIISAESNFVRWGFGKDCPSGQAVCDYLLKEDPVYWGLELQPDNAIAKIAERLAAS